MACLEKDNRFVIHDLETGDRKVIEVVRPQDCASSPYYIAITTLRAGLHLFSTEGVLVRIVPESTKASCVAFHPRNTNILAAGYINGSVHMWDASTQACVCSFKEHTYGITNIRWASDRRVFLSSNDYTASIVTLDDQFQIASAVKLKGHTDWVTGILPLPSSNKCVTRSADQTIKVWDCQTGACLRTLTEHTDWAISLAMHPSGQYFVSGSIDHSVIFWSSETFEALRHIHFPGWINSLVFGESDTLYVGVSGHGVMSCNALTGEAGPVIIQGMGLCYSLSLGKSPLCHTSTPLTHTRNSTVPAPKPWTSSTHALWPLPAQHIVHMAVVVLWKVYKQYPQMYLPYELVEIILRHV